MQSYLYLLFGGCVVWLIYFVPGAVIVRLGIFTLSLAVTGIFVCRADWRTAALYAVLTVEIMQLGYGIVKSLSSILYPHLSAFDQETVGFVFMTGGDGVASLNRGLLCYGTALFFR